MSAGTYRIKSGDAEFFGSSTNLRRDRSDHEWRLKAGIHPSGDLQKAFHKTGKYSWVVTSYTDESDTGSVSRWEDPDFRAYISKVRRERGVGSSTRKKMADAKRGERNPKARAVIVTHPDGREERFSCATDAAAFFGVSQQVFDLWMRGVVAWPNDRSRIANRWVAAYRARFEDEYVV